MRLRRVLGSFAVPVVLVLSVAAATVAPAAPAKPEAEWERAAMTALLANAETLLEAKRMVDEGRPIFAAIDHRVVSETPGDRENGRYPTVVEEFKFEVHASFGDYFKPVALLTVLQTTTRYPRAPGVEYAAKVEPYPAGVILGRDGVR